MKNILIILFFFELVYGLNILVYQTLPGSSHITFSGKIVDTLVTAGHTVVSFELFFLIFIYLITFLIISGQTYY